MLLWAAPSLYPAPPVNSLLVNGAFSSGMTSWGYYIDAAASGSITVSGGELFAAINSGGTADWNIQATQGGLDIINGPQYQVTFNARSTTASRTINVAIQEDGLDYTTYGSQDFSISTTMKGYTYSFIMTEATDLNSRISLNMGNNNNDVYIDNIAVVILSSGPTPTPTATPSGISNGTNIQQWTWNGSNAQLWKLVGLHRCEWLPVAIGSCKLNAAIPLNNRDTFC